MNKFNYRKLLLFLSILLAIGSVILELYCYYYSGQILYFNKLTTIAFISWLAYFVLVVERGRKLALIPYIIALICILILLMISIVWPIVFIIIFILGYILSKLARKREKFIGKLFIDLGLILVGLSLLLLGLAYLKHNIEGSMVVILWIIAGISFCIGIIITALATPKQTLRISIIITITLGFLLLTTLIISFFLSGEQRNNFPLLFVITLIVALLTLFVIEVELVLYRNRKNKFIWLDLAAIITLLISGCVFIFVIAISSDRNMEFRSDDIFSMLIGSIPIGSFTIGYGILLGRVAAALFPHWNDIFRYLFPKRIRVPYRELDSIAKPKSGFTLIEMLIVIAIIAIISIGLISTFGMVLGGIRHSELQTQAIYLAQSEIDYLRSIPFMQLKDETYMTLRSVSTNPMAESICRIKLESEKEGLKKTTIRIQWYEGTQPRQIELVTLITKK
jgi:prepilin-type N-terminal cleavage/methylation domain-containing protein